MHIHKPFYLIDDENFKTYCLHKDQLADLQPNTYTHFMKKT